MDTERVQTLLDVLATQGEAVRRASSHSEVNEATGACWVPLDDLSEELSPGDTPQRFGPLVYSLRSVYGQMEQTRAMVDMPRLVDWADAVIARIRREVSQAEARPQPPATTKDDLYPTTIAAASPIPDGAREFVIFESLARPGFRVACYHTGTADELFGLDGKPRVPPDPTKWEVVAYTKLPEGLDLIPPAAMALPGDEGLPDWNAKPPANAVLEPRAHCPAPVCGSLELVGTPVCAHCHSKLEWDGGTPRLAGEAQAAPDPSAVG